MQLLVRVVDKISTDASKNIQLTKRGDVIAVKPDGADWGLEELINPEWRIIHVPDMNDIEAQNLLQPEPKDNLAPNKPTQKRLIKIDLDALIVKGYIVDKPRPIATKAAAEANIATKTLTADSVIPKADIPQVVKPVSKDPNVIGPDPIVIG